MAFSITPTTPSFSDNSGGLAVAWTGATTGTAYHYVFLAFKINGVTIWTKTFTNPAVTGGWTFAFTQAAIWGAMLGKPFTGSVSIYAENGYDNGYDIPTVYGTITRTGGTITITGRLTAGASWVTKPTTANPWNLDAANPVLTLAWTRPHAAFRARIKIDVWNGSSFVTKFNRYYFTTSCNFDITPYVSIATLIAAMNGVSPRDVRIQLIHQFQTSADDATDIPGASAILKTSTSAMLHSFYEGSKVGIHNGSAWVDHDTYIYDGATWNLQQVYVFNGTSWVESL